MQFEGTQVNIPIKGIMRAGTDNLSADGAMNEVIGMEYKDGSWLPYIMTEEGVTFTDTVLDGGIKKVYVHKTSDGNSHYVVISTNNTLFYEYDRTGEDQQILLVQLTQNVSDIEFIGNMLCVSKESGMEYYLWKENRYDTELETSAPAIDLRVTLGLKQDTEGDDVVGIRYVTRLMHQESKIAGSTEHPVVVSALTSALGEVRDRGGLTGYLLACVAFRNKNGEIEKVLPPVLLNKPNAAYTHPYNLSRSNPGAETPIYNGTFYEYDEQNNIIFQSPTTYEMTSEYRDTDTVTQEGFSTIRMINPGQDTGCCKSSGENDGRKLYLIYKQKSDFPYSPDAYSWDTARDYEQYQSPLIPDLLCTINQISFSVNDYDYYLYAYAASNKLQFKVSNLGDIDEFRKRYNSVCIFISPEISPYLIDKNIDFSDMMMRSTRYKMLYESYNDASSYAKSHFPKKRKTEDVIDELSKINSMYLVEELSLSNLEESEDWIDINLEGKLGDNLVVREQLPFTAFDNTKTLSGELGAYNYRLHQFDYKQELFAGYPLPSFGHHGGFGQYPEEYYEMIHGQYLKWEAKVTIKDDNGETRVTVFDNEELEKLIKTLSPIITYPDKNAESITIAVYYYPGTSSPQKREQTFYFSHDGGLGLAYYIDPELKPIVVALAQGDVPSGNLPSENYQPYNTERIYHNGLKVSDVAYPSYFPAKYTYRIGNEKIIGLARLTIPVSQDNYGADRLIVFCTDGIYSLGVDRTGSGVYTDTQYANPEVCVNANSICEIGGAVIFASDKGLMMLSSNGVEEFTPHLNGEIRFRPDSTGQYIKDGQHIYDKMVTDPLLTELSGSLSTQDFIDYLHEADTVVSYISKKNMLVVYNKNKTYIYLIDIATRNTTKLDICIAFDDDNSPVETYFVENVNTWTSRVFGYRSQEGSTDCLIQSRPIKIQQDDKCSYRLVVTGYFEGAENTDKWAGLIVLGGLDGDHWQVIGVNNECLDAPFHNIGCVTNRGSWKYLMFIFAGHLSTESHIDSIDITVESKYRNKKR